MRALNRPFLASFLLMALSLPALAIGNGAKAQKQEEAGSTLFQERQKKARENLEQRWRADEVLRGHRQEEQEREVEPLINPQDDFKDKEGSSGF